MANLLVSPRQALCDLLAACPTFRTVVGAADSAAASVKIKSPYAGDDAADTGRRALVAMPRAIINRADEFKVEKAGIGWGRSTGNLFLSLQFLPAAAAAGDPDDELDAFEQTVGDIIAEMMARSAKDPASAADYVRTTDADQTHLNVTAIDLVVCGECVEQNEAGQLWYGAVLLVTYIG